MGKIEKKNCEYCGGVIFRRKGKMGQKGEVKIAWTVWPKVRFCSKECKIKGTKGEWWNKKTTFKKGNVPHNKGVVKSVVRKSGGWSKFLRKNAQYYVQELRENALRRKERGYDKNREDQIKERRAEVVEMCGVHGRQDWHDSEIDFLRENYVKLNIWEIALKLERSYASVSRKLNRLELKQNNKWI